MNKALQAAMDAAARDVLTSQAADTLYGVQVGADPIVAWPKTPCRLVFLDFDGVMNSEASNRELGTRYRFAPDSVAALKRILMASRAFIVITSSWRRHWSLRENAAYLLQAGVPACVLGKTPGLETTRGAEIQQWLAGAPYPVESFVILDDRTDMDQFVRRLIQIDPENGLNQQHIEPALAILNEPWVRP